MSALTSPNWVQNVYNALTDEHILSLTWLSTCKLNVYLTDNTFSFNKNDSSILLDDKCKKDIAKITSVTGMKKSELKKVISLHLVDNFIRNY